MTAEWFLDTNIVAYAFDKANPEKRDIALSLMNPESPWKISWQVIQEFSNVGLHKFKVPLTADFLEEYLKVILWPHCHVFPSASLYETALRIHRESQYRFYDCLIVGAALESGAGILFSEDLQHGRSFGHLRIVNPFLK